MKASVIFFAAALFGTGAHVYAEQADSTGMPGDNLDLYAVMDQFKKADNLESFEKAINDPNNKINNLDLNNDGQTDYIRVIDNTDSGAHAIVLQVPYSQSESQDVAVIEVEQNGVENASVRIVGDEDVYGENYVVEPYENYVGKEEYDAQHSPTNNTKSTSRVVVNVYTWPVVTYIYRPVYRPWRSPWYWGYYPGWWRPWRPYHWHVYHGYVAHYHGHGYWYRRTPVYHPHQAHHVYYANRTTSVSYKRTAPVPKTTVHGNNTRKYEKGTRATGNNNHYNKQPAGNRQPSGGKVKQPNNHQQVNRHSGNSGRQKMNEPRQPRQKAPRQPRNNGGGARQKPGGKRGG